MRRKSTETGEGRLGRRCLSYNPDLKRSSQQYPHKKHSEEMDSELQTWGGRITEAQCMRREDRVKKRIKVKKKRSKEGGHGNDDVKIK